MNHVFFFFFLAHISNDQGLLLAWCWGDHSVLEQSNLDFLHTKYVFPLLETFPWSANECILLCFGGPHQWCSRLAPNFAQGSLLVGLEGPYALLGIKPNVLLAGQMPCQSFQYFLNSELVKHLFFGIVSVCFGATPAVVRVYFWLCSGITPGKLRRPFGVPTIEPKLTANKTNTLPIVFQLCFISFHLRYLPKAKPALYMVYWKIASFLTKSHNSIIVFFISLVIKAYV